MHCVYLWHYSFPASVVDVAHEIVEVVDSVEANARLCLESSQGLRQVVLLSKDCIIVACHIGTRFRLTQKRNGVTTPSYRHP